jgi:A/G-specific adenine glycosylase
MNEGYFSKKIIGWYQENHRDLPWRNTQDAYKIWLSEIILQQTRVAQGLPYYEKFILQFPDVNSLAKAKERDVLRLWQGLGYYTRARNLHKCAREVVRKFNGRFPQTFGELKQLPGIGDYTAAAIASFAFNERVAVVDGNVFRVLSRVFGVDKNIASSEGKIFFTSLANQLISEDEPAMHNQAVMEFGALHCLPQNPHCEDCVFKKNCVAFQQDLQHVLPVKIKKQKITKRFFYYFLVRSGNKILMTERTGKGIWKGLYDFPLHEEKSMMSAEKILKKFFPRENHIETSSGNTISEEYKHVLSHQIIRARFIQIDWPSLKTLPLTLSHLDARWHSLKQVGKLPKPVLIARYLADRSILPES